jgi:threonine dehydratase
MITPHEELAPLAQTLGLAKLFIKREDLHPYGSHKGRSLPHMIDRYVELGNTHFVISSSGNAARASLLHIKKLNTSREQKLTLVILVGLHINEEKFSFLRENLDSSITLVQVERPLQELKKLESEGYVSLRQSTDNSALHGYESLAAELLEIKDLKSVFIPASSGTCAEAIGRYFKNARADISLFIVQTDTCHPIVSSLGGSTYETLSLEEESLADAIVDIVGHRKHSLGEVVADTGGAGVIVTNTYIQSAQQKLKENGVEATGNGALALAGLLAYQERNSRALGVTCCILCGK